MCAVQVVQGPVSMRVQQLVRCWLSTFYFSQVASLPDSRPGADELRFHKGPLLRVPICMYSHASCRRRSCWRHCQYLPLCKIPWG